MDTHQQHVMRHAMWGYRCEDIKRRIVLMDREMLNLLFEMNELGINKDSTIENTSMADLEHSANISHKIDVIQRLRVIEETLLEHAKQEEPKQRK